MPTEKDLQEELRVLERRWRHITDIPESPRTLLGIIEYSLGEQRKAEVYANRLLRYFLDPDEPHGMEADFLRAFLQGLPTEVGFEEDVYDLSDVQVADQVRIYDEESGRQTAESPGFVDLIIEVPNEWFLLIELKFGAGENSVGSDGPSQTESYFRASHLGDRRKTAYESGRYYLYVRPRDEPEAEEERFSNWSWTSLTENVVSDVLASNAPRYPRRTVTQLREFVDDVQEITGMTEKRASESEKIELYLDHYDAISDVVQTFDDRWKAFTAEWGDRLRDALEADGIDASDWTFRVRQSDWAHLFKDGWWRETDQLETIRDRADDRNDVRISFIHRLEQNRDVAVGDRTLIFTFRNCGSNDREFRNRFNRQFDDRSEEIDRALPETAELADERRTLIRATYDIRTDRHDDFFDAYVDALRRAFADHAVENPELLQLLDRTYDEALELYR